MSDDLYPPSDDELRRLREQAEERMAEAALTREGAYNAAVTVGVFYNTLVAEIGNDEHARDIACQFLEHAFQFDVESDTEHTDNPEEL